MGFGHLLPANITNLWDMEDWSPRTKDIINQVLMSIFLALVIVLIIIICFCARCSILSDRICTCLGLRKATPTDAADTEQNLRQMKRNREQAVQQQAANGQRQLEQQDGGGGPVEVVIVKEQPATAQDGGQQPQPTKEANGKEKEDHFDRCETSTGGKLYPMYRNAPSKPQQKPEPKTNNKQNKPPTAANGTAPAAGPRQGNDGKGPKGADGGSGSDDRSSSSTSTNNTPTESIQG